MFRNHGSVDAEFAKGGKAIEASYYTPMAAHASMEPPAAVAEFRDNKVTAWAPTQNPQAVQDTVAAALGIDKKDVICHVTLLGGGFGRKSKPDYVAEAAVLSKKLGKPVKVVWNREDDLRCDYYHSVAAVYHKAALDARGRPTAWLSRSAFPPIASTFDPKARYGLGFEYDMGFSDLPYAVANLRAESGPAENHVRIGWFRAVANNYHAFAASSFGAGFGGAVWALVDRPDAGTFAARWLDAYRDACPAGAQAGAFLAPASSPLAETPSSM